VEVRVGVDNEKHPHQSNDSDEDLVPECFLGELSLDLLTSLLVLTILRLNKSFKLFELCLSVLVFLVVLGHLAFELKIPLLSHLSLQLLLSWRLLAFFHQVNIS